MSNKSCREHFDIKDNSSIIKYAGKLTLSLFNERPITSYDKSFPFCLMSSSRQTAKQYNYDILSFDVKGLDIYVL